MDDYTGHTLDECAKQDAGNWLKFDSYGRHRDEDPIDATWAVFYTSTRDSGIIDQVNSEVIGAALEAFGDDVRDESANHWACGYVSGHAIRVYDSAGQITAAYRKWVELQLQIDIYPILDDEAVNERQFDAAIDACFIEQEDVAARVIRTMRAQSITWGSKVYVVNSLTGQKMPARVASKKLWVERGAGSSIPVVYITAEGFKGWDHAVWVLPANIEVRS